MIIKLFDAPINYWCYNTKLTLLHVSSLPYEYATSSVRVSMNNDKVNFLVLITRWNMLEIRDLKLFAWQTNLIKLAKK